MTEQASIQHHDDPDSRDRPHRVRLEDAHYLFWGDDTAGEVADWIYVSNQKVHQIVWSLPVGGSFQHSQDNRPVYSADVFYYVLQGTLVLANPERGEVHRLSPGDTVFFRRDTWHNGFNNGVDNVRVLEFISPPPATGSTREYAKSVPDLPRLRYADDDMLEHWPAEREAWSRHRTMIAQQPGDLLWRLEGTDDRVLVGIYLSTEHMTVGRIEVPPSRKSEFHRHGGAEVIYCLEGCLTVQTSAADGDEAWEIGPGDCCYLPEALNHRYVNAGDKPGVAVFMVAPSYNAPRG